MKIYQSDFINKEAYFRVKDGVKYALKNVEAARKFINPRLVNGKGEQIEEVLWKCHLGLDNLEFVG